MLSINFSLFKSARVNFYGSKPTTMTDIPCMVKYYIALKKLDFLKILIALENIYNILLSKNKSHNSVYTMMLILFKHYMCV